MDRAVRNWIIAGAILIVVFAGAVVTLNVSLYSASGFVGSYLNAIARHDVTGALAIPGVSLPTGSKTLLRADALSSLDDIHLVSDTAGNNGTHRLVYDYRAGGAAGSSTFTVERAGVTMGLFSAWRFSESPVSVLSIAPVHANSFIANGLAVTATTNVSSPYLVLTPTRVTLTHRSTYLSAPTTHVLVDGAVARKATAVETRANTAFVKEVQKQLDSYLAACVKQKVLLPTGCPMGQQISDRIQNAPTWSMVQNPVVTIVPTAVAGTWQVPDSPAAAHLVVTVKSIFDGTVSTFDQDVPFSVGYLVTFETDGSLLITAQY
jgi:hypothetical protein